MSAQTTAVNPVATAPQSPSLITKFAAKFGVEPNKMLTTLKATAFRGEVSNEQMMALLIVSDQYSLNPWTKEIYAFPDRNNGIVPVVGVDGWSRIINSNSQFDGMEFETLDDGSQVTCTIWRKDRTHPISVTEYLSECRRKTQPWDSHPRRMLRHKAMIQCARLAFGYVGIYDEDEAERIIEGQHSIVSDEPPEIKTINEQIAGKAETKSPLFTVAEVGEKIRNAKTRDELDEARALFSAFPENVAEQLRADADRKEDYSFGGSTS